MMRAKPPPKRKDKTKATKALEVSRSPVAAAVSLEELGAQLDVMALVAASGAPWPAVVVDTRDAFPVATVLRGGVVAGRFGGPSATAEHREVRLELTEIGAVALPSGKLVVVDFDVLRLVGAAPLV